MRIIFSKHALDRIKERGATKEEIKISIKEGESGLSRGGRKFYRKNFIFNSYWKGRSYKIKQVMPIVKVESRKIIVITVYVFYFGGENYENKI